jgi:serine/threonine-protein kinase
MMRRGEDRGLQGGDRIGDFVLEGLHGGGGMGEVWKAFHESTGRHVAIKVLRQDYSSDPELARRFLREVQVLARLDHPHIVRVHHAFVEGQQSYLVLEFIEGRTLEQFRRDGARLARNQYLEWFRQLTEALVYVHGQRVLHRDIKPSNIIIDSRTLRARLIDFGIALSGTADSRLTAGQGSPLTPEYASPEQYRGEPVDARSDVYSLALSILHVWQLGYPPRRPSGAHDWRLPQDTPGPIVQVFRRCLAARPEDRFRRSEDLLVALDRVLETPGSAPWSSRPWVRPRVALALAGSAVAVLAVVLLAWKARGPIPPRMITIPAGDTVTGMDLASIPEDLRAAVGSWENLRRGGARRQFVQAFKIDRYEVTNSEYARFVRATGRTPPEHWDGPQPPAGIAAHPVVNVTHADARAYAEWVGKRLPTADEWERAARGKEGLVYPWGNQFLPAISNTLEAALRGTCAVDLHPRDASPFGVIGMGGNVTEWTATPLKNDEDGTEGYVVCGGSWLELGKIVSMPALRRLGNPGQRYSDVGFRCAK